MDQNKLLLKPNEAAEMLGIGRMRIYELVRQNRIPTVRVGMRVRIPTEALREWIRSEVGPPAAILQEGEGRNGRSR